MIMMVRLCNDDRWYDDDDDDKWYADDGDKWYDDDDGIHTKSVFIPSPMYYNL